MNTSQAAELPWQTAKRVWESQNPGMSFEMLLGRYVAVGGVVWSSPDRFVLALPVSLDRTQNMVHDPDHGDTWFLHLAAQSGGRSRSCDVLRGFMALAPHPLPFVAWHRRQSKRLHRYPWARVASLANLKPTASYGNIC